MVVEPQGNKPVQGSGTARFSRIKESKGGRYLGAAIVFFIILFAVAYGFNTR